MRSTFKVLFYLKRNAPKKNGLIPVMCRITVNGKISQFSCKLDVEENSVSKAYIQDENFGSLGSDINMWKFYNLLTGANKSSYIDSFLDRSLNATEMAVGINSALHGDEKYK